MFKILLAEDEVKLNKIISSTLLQEGYLVFSALNGKEAYEKVLEEPMDLIITDIMMPLVDGNELTKRIRALYHDVPILMLTALEAIDDKERGFNSGADDYLTKPFALKELLLRVRALLRRYQKVSENKLVFPHTTLDYNTMSVRVNGIDAGLSRKEFQTLFYLVSNPNTILSRDQIIQEIWGYDSESYDRTVDTHITWIRSKVDSPDFKIVTVRGLGYKAVIL